MENEERALSVQPTGESVSPMLMDRLTALMQGMADTIKATNDRLTALEKEMRHLAPVTGGQAEAIGQAIRDRALELAERTGVHQSPEAVREIANLIRKAVRLGCGVRSVRELPRVEYYVILERIAYWDDYKQLKAVRERYREEVVT